MKQTQREQLIVFLRLLGFRRSYGARQKKIIIRPPALMSSNARFNAISHLGLVPYTCSLLLEEFKIYFS